MRPPALLPQGAGSHSIPLRLLVPLQADRQESGQQEAGPGQGSPGKAIRLPKDGSGEKREL